MNFPLIVEIKKKNIENKKNILKNMQKKII